jgi:hypothetical protein
MVHIQATERLTTGVLVFKEVHMLTTPRLIFFALFLITTFITTAAQSPGVASAYTSPATASKTSSEVLSSQESDATPTGMVAFFSPTTTACPANWVVPQEVSGRLILGVTDASRVGVTYGLPMADKTPPVHSHTYSAKVKMSSKSLQAGKGNNDDGAKAKTYELNKSTNQTTLNLPFYQLVICQKQ